MTFPLRCLLLLLCFAPLADARSLAPVSAAQLWNSPKTVLLPGGATRYAEHDGYLAQCDEVSRGDTAKACGLDRILAMLPILDPCGHFGKVFGIAMGIAGGLMNSFTPETLVHVKPEGAKDEDAQAAEAELKPIGESKPGDEVLAWPEWKDAGNNKPADPRFSYEKVTDVFTSLREQKLIYIELETGETLTATEGHPFRTTEGWRDAILLKKGGKLLLKGTGENDSDPRPATSAEDAANEDHERIATTPSGRTAGTSERTAEIVEVRLAACRT